MKYKVGKSEDGRLVIRGDFYGYFASYDAGAWTNTCKFSAYELSEDFTVVRDPIEAQEIFEEADRVLGLTDFTELD